MPLKSVNILIAPRKNTGSTGMDILKYLDCVDYVRRPVVTGTRRERWD